MTGTPNQEAQPETRSPWPAILREAIAALAIVYVALWNIRTLDFDKYVKYFPRSLNGFGHISGLGQRWGMFAPRPLTGDGWYVIVGTLKNGSQVDLFKDGQPVSWEKPERVARTYKNQRWRKYMMNLAERKNSRYRRPFSQYLRNEWDAEHKGDEDIYRIETFFIRETTLPDYQPPKHRKVRLSRYTWK